MSIENSDEFEGTFHEAIWPVLIFAQLFGVMPVSGIRSRSVAELKFKWNSKRSIYSWITAGILLSYILISTKNLIFGTESVGFSTIGLSTKMHRSSLIIH